MEQQELSKPKIGTDLTHLVLRAQAGYYIATGVWGLVDIRSFQKVTGPKVDTWLVKTVSVLVIVIGSALGLAARRRRATAEIALLGVGSTFGFTAIDVFYVARRRIWPVYLLDALAEVVLAGLWGVALRKQGGFAGQDAGTPYAYRTARHRRTTPSDHL